MRITIIYGFFLPVPPRAGGATEKSWFRLGEEFAARGHQVTAFSRSWAGLPARETVAGVEHRRLPGFDHTTSLAGNLLRDFLWSWRVFRALPEADIVVCHAVSLPVWLGRWRPHAGRVVLMPGRLPKGQYRRYAAVARVLAPSSFVRDAVAGENPAFAARVLVTGYPIDWRALSTAQSSPAFLPPPGSADEVTIGYVGRLHEEKGLRLLVEAASLLAREPGLPPWRLVLCGPSDIARGGSGPGFQAELRTRLSAVLPTERWHMLEPQFDETALAALYRRLDIFCYPSLAEKGETFGVAVAEAMAAGAAAVTSQLPCFPDFVRDGATGLTFDHRAPDTAARLAQALARLLRDRALRQEMAARGRAEVRRFDYPIFAASLLEDFAGLTRH
jgi:glycosyltransferase involved in cell wall biosynthesis